MKYGWKRLTAVLLVCSMLMGLFFSGNVFAAENDGTGTEATAQTEDADNLDTASDENLTESDIENISAAAAYIREQMTQRETVITGSFAISDMGNMDSVFEALADQIFICTSESDEGDYLKQHNGGMSWNYEASFDGSVTTFSYELRTSYYTTLEQEQEVADRIDEVLAELSLDGLSDYEKAKKIYDYISINVSYDYEHLSDSSYMLSHTAYAALIQETAVCQGYASLFYRMAHEAGLSVRIVTGLVDGEAHAWNIVKIGDLYYYVDTTHASSSGNRDDYFLKGSISFADRQLDSDYLSADFTSEFPMSDFDYSDDSGDTEVSNGELTADIQWTVKSSTDEAGETTYYLEFRGDGEMPDYAMTDELPWEEWRDEITLVMVGSGITKIGSYVFSGMNALTTVQIANTVTVLGEGAFYNCGKLTNLQIPDSVTSIGSFAVGGSYGETRWEYNPVEKKLTVTGNGVMGEPYVEGSTTEKNASRVPWNRYRDQIEEVVIEEGVENLSTYALHGMTSLTAVTLPSTLEEIGEGSFESCTALTYICIPDSVKTIGHYAFRYCEGLRSIHIPASVTSIGVRAFADCAYLHEFYFYGDAPTFEKQAIMDSEYITVYYDGSGWSDVKSLFEYLTFETWEPGEYDDSGTNVSGEGIKSQTSGKYGDDIEWNYDEESAVLTLSGKGEMGDPITIVTVDETTNTTTTSYSTNAVPWNPFNQQIKEVVISDGITSISRYAFWWLTQIESITIPDSVITVGQQSFVHCSKLQTVTFGDDLTTIGKEAFKDCTALKEIYISDKLASVEESAFTGCETLADVYYEGSENEWGDIVIGEDNDPLINAEIHYNYKEDNPKFDQTHYISSVENSIKISAEYYSEKPVTKEAINWSCDNGNAIKFGETIIQDPTTTGKENIYSISVQVTCLREGDCNITLTIGETSDIAMLTILPEQTVETKLDFKESFYSCNENETISVSAIYVSDEDPENIIWTCDDADAVTFSGTSIQGPAITGVKNTYWISTQITCPLAGKYEITLNVGEASTSIELTVLLAHVITLTPENGGRLVDLSMLECSIEFDEMISFTGSGNAYLVTSDEDEVIQTIPLIDDSINALIGLGDNQLLSKLTLYFNRDSSLLDAGTEYYIRIDKDAIEYLDADTETSLQIDFNGILNKNVWRFKTIDTEYPLISNSDASEEIPWDIYRTLYKPITAKLIQMRDNGTEGICWGFSYAVGAWREKYEAIRAIGNGLDKMMEFQLNSQGSLDYSFLEYLQLAQVYQYQSDVQDSMKESSDQLDELYNNIVKYLNGESPAIIVCAFNSKNSGHAIVPVGIVAQDDESVTFAVYNCNGFEGRYLSQLKLIKENGQFVNWEFSDYNDGEKAKLQYYIVENILDTCVSLSESNIDNANMIFSTTEIPELDELNAVTDIESIPNNSKHLYWVDDSEVKRASSKSTSLSEIGITDGYYEISINAPLNSEVDLNLEAKTISVEFEENTDFTAIYRWADNEDNFRSTKILGNGGNAFKAEEKDDGILIKSDELVDVNVITTENDKEKSELTFSTSEDSALISEVDNKLVVLVDTDDDGIYETDVNEKEEHVHAYGAPEFTWSADYTACTAVFTCEAGDNEQKIECEVTSRTTDPTCTESGKSVYTAAVTFDGNDYTDTKEKEIAATGHTYRYTDNGDGTHTKACTFGDDMTTEPHTYQNGTCTYCGAEEPEEHTHEYGEPEFIWSEDYKSCTVVFTCESGDDEQRIECEVSGSITEPTCTEDGKTVYTATASFSGKEYTDTQEEVISATGHTYKYTDNGDGTHTRVCTAGDDTAKEPHTYQDGICTYCGAEEPKEHVHEYGIPEFKWSEDYTTCIAVFTCKDGDDQQSIECEVTDEVTDATCTENGKAVYTAKVIFADKEYTDVKEQEIPASGHAYGTPEFDWSEDYQTCTAVFTCESCDDEQKIECDITSETTEPTCTEDGKKVYTATVTFADKEYTDTQEEVIIATGHTYEYTDNGDGTHTKVCTAGDDTATEPHTYQDGICTYCGAEEPKEHVHEYGIPEFKWSGDYTTCTAVFTCKDGDDQQSIECEVTDEVTDPTCTESGKTVYTAAVTFGGTDYTDTKETEIAATGHTYRYTDNGDGTHTKVCTFGDDTVTEPHTYQNGICTYCGAEEPQGHVHTYGDPEFRWSEDNKSCTAVFTCIDGDDQQTADCTVTSSDNGDGTVTFTAEVEFNGASYTDTRTVKISEEPDVPGGAEEPEGPVPGDNTSGSNDKPGKPAAGTAGASDNRTDGNVETGVKTGDDNSILLWSMMLAAATIGAGIIFFGKKKRAAK